MCLTRGAPSHLDLVVLLHCHTSLPVSCAINIFNLSNNTHLPSELFISACFCRSSGQYRRNSHNMQPFTEPMTRYIGCNLRGQRNR
ncbi:hypothetical protein BKA66DRAFT_70170 [Pyrenochaeta sp. MPI-SDFR-AT-0127]|nr:hypothetical protein BKA66DRAFT_70170 [Pyrenochaeta sp. MPI-SDFR-AT-0127]